LAPLHGCSGSSSGRQSQASTHLRQALSLLFEQGDEGQAEGQALAGWQALVGSKGQGLRDMLPADHLRAGGQAGR
jgi:hypothetical protein